MILAALDPNVLISVLITAIIGPVVLVIANRRLSERRPTEREAIARDREAMWERLEEGEKRCQRDLAVERWRTALLIRAMQEAGILVPEAAFLRIDYDPTTDTYRVTPD